MAARRGIELSMEEVAHLAHDARMSMTLQAARYGRPQSAEVRIVMRDGTLRHAKGETVLDALDEMRHTLVELGDVTEEEAYNRRATDPREGERAGDLPG